MAHLTKEEVAEVVQAITDEEAAAMNRMARQILALWGADPSATADLLGPDGSAAATYSVETKLKLFCIMGIHGRLRQIFAAKDRASRWMTLTNAAFQGDSALDVIQQERADGLLRVWAYLEGVGNC